MFMDGSHLLPRWSSQNLWFSLALAQLNKSLQFSRVGWSDRCSLKASSGGWMYRPSKTCSTINHLETTLLKWPSGADG